MTAAGHVQYVMFLTEQNDRESISFNNEQSDKLAHLSL